MRDRLIQLVDLLPAAAAVALLVNLVLLWAARIPYPYDLEWMEGGMLAHSWRLQQGLAIYVTPGPDFIPYVYPPGYASLVAILGSVFGLTYPLARMVALSGTFVAASALVYGVVKQTGSLRMGAVSAVVFLGTYPASGAFYDLIRPDALYLAFLAWAIVLAVEQRKGAVMAAGLLLAAGFLMKHNAAAFGLPIAVALWYRDGWRKAAQFALFAAVPAGLMTVYLQWGSGGHFLVYLLEVPTSHPRIWSRVLPGMFRDVGTALPILSGTLGLWAILYHGKRLESLPEYLSMTVPIATGVFLAWYGFTLGHPAPGTYHFGASFAFWGLGAGATSAVLYLMIGQRPSWQWVYGLALLVTGLVMAALMRAHNGGFLNVYMHVYWLMALAFGLVLAQWRQVLRKEWVIVATALLAASQIGWQLGRLDRAKLSPTEADRIAGDAFVEAIRDIDGPVLSPFAAWIPVYAGKEPSLHLIALWDLNYKHGPYYAEVESIKTAVAEHHWAAVIDGSKPLGYGLQKAYIVAETPDVPKGALAPKMGWPARPARIVVPKPDK